MAQPGPVSSAQALAAAAQQPTAAPAKQKSPDLNPTLNNYIRSTLSKTESPNFSEIVQSLVQLKDYDEKQAEGLARPLQRLLQYGHLPVSTLPLALQALNSEAGQRMEDRSLTRVLYYIVQLALGQGAAGTPLPLAANAGHTQLAKAIKRHGAEELAPAWAQLASDKAPFVAKQAALRALAALAAASLVILPDDATYVGGLFMTLSSLLDKVDGMRAQRRSLGHFLSQAAAGNRKKAVIQDFRQRAEIAALLRLAFSAARVALPRSGLAVIAMRSFPGVSSMDPVCARHAMALAAQVAKDPQACRTFIEEVEPLLRVNVEVAKATGVLVLAGPHKPGGPAPHLRDSFKITGGGGDGAAAAAAAVVGAGSGGGFGSDGSSVNLRDPWCRVYLARACAAALQSGFIAGDVTSGPGATFWAALAAMSAYDPSDLVALEAIKAMFGGPYPRALPQGLRTHPRAMIDLEADALQSRIYGASWHMIISQAGTTSPIAPPLAVKDGSGATVLPPDGSGAAAAKAGSGALQAVPSGLPGAVSMGSAGGAGGGGNNNDGVEDRSVFGRAMRRLLYGLQPRGSSARVCSAARAAAVVQEARACCSAMSGGHLAELEGDGVRKWLRQLQNLLLALSSDESQGGVARSLCLEALVWCSVVEGPVAMPLPPAALLRMASVGGGSAPAIVRYTFADPWPEHMVVQVLSMLLRRIKTCTPSFNPGGSGLSPAVQQQVESVLEIATALAAAAPGPAVRECLQALWEAVPGPMAVRSVLALLGVAAPPLACPPTSAAVEVKLLACRHEAEWEGLKAAAATWLGEHINHIAGEYSWKTREQSKAAVAAGDNAGAAAAAVSAAKSTGSTIPSAAKTPSGKGTHGHFPPGGSETNVGGGGGSGAAVSVGPGAAIGGGANPHAHDAERLAVAAARRNPLVALTITHLRRAVLCGSIDLRVAAAQALAKIAVRSSEPYRIQAYSAVAACCGRGPAAMSAAALGGADAAPWGSDPLGLSPVVAPALELLDAMYAGELTVERHIAQWGHKASGWPAPALAALHRRHEWLLGALSMRVCFVPPQLFLPLGLRSRALLFPDEQEQEDKAREAAEQEAAAAAAEARQRAIEAGEYVPEEDEQAAAYDDSDPYREQYGQDADPYNDYDDGTGQYYGDVRPSAGAGAADKLDFSTIQGAAAAAVAMQWGVGAGFDDAASETSADNRQGTVLYAFSAEADGEVSVAAGERITISHDLGDWLHVATASGQHGLVPASYVSIDEGGALPSSSSRALSPAASFATRQGSISGGGRASASGAGGGSMQRVPSYSSTAGGGGDARSEGMSSYAAYNQYDNPEYTGGAASGGGGYDAFGEYGGYGADNYDGYGTGQYGGQYDAYGTGRYGSAGGEYGGSAAVGLGGKKKGGFGGFDDFGSVLAAAAAAPRTSLPPAAAPPPPAAADNDGVSSSAASSTSRNPANLYATEDDATSQPSAPAASPGATGGTYYNNISASGTNGFEGGQPAAGGGYDGGYDDAGAVYGAATGFGGFGGLGDGGGFGEPLPATASVTEPAVVETAVAEEPIAAAASGGRATVVYDFTAEMEGELTVMAGDEVELGPEMDGWYQATVIRDGRSGLIPASYVQML